MTAAASRLLPGIGLVIGSASGIGRSVSFAFARAGIAGLFLADINMKALKATANEIQCELPDLKVVTHQVDVGNEESCINCVRTAAKAFRRIDYMLNHAGIGGNQKLTVEQVCAELQKFST